MEGYFMNFIMSIKQFGISKAFPIPAKVEKMHQCRLRMLMSEIEILSLQSSTYVKKQCEMGNTVSVSCPQAKLTSEQSQNTPRNKEIVTQLPNVNITYCMMIFR